MLNYNYKQHKSIIMNTKEMIDESNSEMQLKLKDFQLHLDQVWQQNDKDKVDKERDSAILAIAERIGLMDDPSFLSKHLWFLNQCQDSANERTSGSGATISLRRH